MTISENNRLVRRVEAQRIDEEYFLPIEATQLPQRVISLADELAEGPVTEGKIVSAPILLSTPVNTYKFVFGYNTLESRPWIKVIAEDGEYETLSVDFSCDLPHEVAKAAGEIILEAESQLRAISEATKRREKLDTEHRALARSIRRYGANFPLGTLRYK